MIALTSARASRIAAGTWWAAYNAVTQWLTHERGAATGSERDRAERRFAELHLGAGRRLGQRALMLALEGAEHAMMLGLYVNPGVPVVHRPAQEDGADTRKDSLRASAQFMAPEMLRERAAELAEIGIIVPNDPADGVAVLDPDPPVIPEADPVDGAA